MRLYWELIQLAFRRQMTYRAAAMAGLATNFFFGLLRVAVMVALYQQTQQVAGMTLQDAITFTGISQATIAFLSLFGWYEIIRSVYNGQVGADLLKPMSYYRFWMAQDLGRALANLLMRGLPIMVFYALFFDITYPRTWWNWAALAAALSLSLLLSFSWRFLVNLSAFWVPNAVGIARFGFTISWFLSGFLMPIRFFPEWFARICYLTPFPHAINTVIEVYLGLLTPVETGLALLGQLAWVVGLTALGWLVMRAGVRRLVILGG